MVYVDQLALLPPFTNAFGRSFSVSFNPSRGICGILANLIGASAFPGAGEAEDNRDNGDPKRDAHDLRMRATPLSLGRGNREFPKTALRFTPANISSVRSAAWGRNRWTSAAAPLPPAQCHVPAVSGPD